MPSFHSHQWRWLPYSSTLKRYALQQRKVSDAALRSLFPDYIDPDLTVQRVSQESLFGLRYHIDSTYAVFVITPRAVQFHRLVTRWRNYQARVEGVPPVYRSYQDADGLATYLMTALDTLHRQTGGVPEPYEVGYLHNQRTTVLLTEYIDNDGKLETFSQEAFVKVLKTLRSMHDTRIIHTALPTHLMMGVPDTPYIINPIGRVIPSESGYLVGVGYDLATLLAAFVPHLTTHAVISICTEFYSRRELAAALHSTQMLTRTTPGFKTWPEIQLKKALIEYLDDEDYRRYLLTAAEKSDDVLPDAATMSDSKIPPVNPPQRKAKAFLTSINETITTPPVQPDSDSPDHSSPSQLTERLTLGDR